MIIFNDSGDERNKSKVPRRGTVSVVNGALLQYNRTVRSLRTFRKSPAAREVD